MQCPGGQQTAERLAACAWQAAARLAQQCGPGKLRGKRAGCSAGAAEGRGLPEIMPQSQLKCHPGPGGLSQLWQLASPKACQTPAELNTEKQPMLKSSRMVGAAWTCLKPGGVCCDGGSPSLIALAILQAARAAEGDGGQPIHTGADLEEQGAVLRCISRAQADFERNGDQLLYGTLLWQVDSALTAADRLQRVGCQLRPFTQKHWGSVRLQTAPQSCCPKSCCKLSSCYMQVFKLQSASSCWALHGEGQLLLPVYAAPHRRKATPRRGLLRARLESSGSPG